MGEQFRELRVSNGLMDSPHVVMVPGGSSDLRFTIQFEGRTALLPTSGQVKSMTFGRVRRQVSYG